MKGKWIIYTNSRQNMSRVTSGTQKQIVCSGGFQQSNWSERVGRTTDISWAHIIMSMREEMIEGKG